MLTVEPRITIKRWFPAHRSRNLEWTNDNERRSMLIAWTRFFQHSCQIDDPYSSGINIYPRHIGAGEGQKMCAPRKDKSNRIAPNQWLSASKEMATRLPDLSQTARVIHHGCDGLWSFDSTNPNKPVEHTRNAPMGKGGTQRKGRGGVWFGSG